MPAQPMAMIADDADASDPEGLPDGPLRRCLAARAVRPKSALPRFVVGRAGGGARTGHGGPRSGAPGKFCRTAGHGRRPARENARCARQADGLNMTEMNETEPKKSLSLSRPGRLELKKTVDAGSVRQSFPHGRTKTVQVEVKKKRTYAPGAGGGMTEVVQPLETGKQVEETASAAVIAAEAALEERIVQGRHLTAGERAARQRA